jgi:predicted GH43/DUF377 family glycosyl hydrolase
LGGLSNEPNRSYYSDPKDPYETNYIGGGLPPIETSCGWLLIYHGVNETATGKVYHAKAALFHLENLKWNYQDCLSLFTNKKMGKEGVVNNVVFPTGHALFGDDLYIYYGAADMHAVAKVSLTELLDELKNNHKYNSTMRLEKGLKCS